MNRLMLQFGLVLSFLVVPTLSFATALTGLKATPMIETGQLQIQWTAPDSSTTAQSDGYAIQWSDTRSDIHIQKPVRLYTNNTSKDVRLRTFDRGTDYFFRVYTYTKDGRKYTLSNGSKILKWRRISGNKTETSEIAITDPVIANNSTNNNSSSESTFEFGKLRSLALDTFVDLNWSRPSKMAKSDYDGFYITLSKNANMDSPIKSFKVDRDHIKARIKGLEPKTQYYAQGAFYKEKNKQTDVFGKSPVKSFVTVEAIDRTVNSRQSRNLAKIEKQNYFTVSLDENETSTTKTKSSKKKTSPNTDSKSSLRTRIANLKRKIAELQQELRTLEAQLSGKSKNVTHVKTRTRSKSLRERLRERLAKRRR